MTESSKRTIKSASPGSKKPSQDLSKTPEWPFLHLSDPVLLALLLLLLLLLRWQMTGMALERDESAYAYLGKCLFDGQRPYLDFYEMKPPLLFGAYAGIVWLFGYSLKGLHWAALFFTAVNAVLVLGIGRMLLPRLYALWACAAYILLCSSPCSVAVFMESELVLMAFALGGLYLFLKWDAGTDKSWPTLWASGVLLAAAALVKQTGVVFLLAPAVVLLYHFWVNKARSWPDFLKNTGIVALGVAAPIALCLGWMYALGVWKEFLFWNFEYPAQYVSTVNSERSQSLLRGSLLVVTQGFQLYWYLGGLGLLSLLFYRAKGRQRLFLFVFSLCSLAAVGAGRYFYFHYWLQFLPALAILTAFALYAVQNMLKDYVPRWLLPLLAVGLLAYPFAAWGQQWLRPTPDALTNAIFKGNAFVEDRVLADYLRKKMQPGDELAVLGSEPQIYVYLNRKAPSRHFYSAILSRPTRQSATWQKEALDSLISKQPKYVVFPILTNSWSLQTGSDPGYYQGAWTFTQTHYRPIGWADLQPSGKTQYVLDESRAAAYQPAGKEYIIVLQRKE